MVQFAIGVMAGILIAVITYESPNKNKIQDLEQELDQLKGKF